MTANEQNTLRTTPETFPLPEAPAPRTVTVQDKSGEACAAFGGGSFGIIGGPCAVESREQLLEVAEAVASSGAALLRGGAFKPRTRPESFQGLGHEGLALLREASERTGLPVVTEVLDPREVEAVASVASMLQIGSRNMQNVPVLREAGRTGLPVMLKRGASATIEEFLAAAEYVRAENNENVVLCERGVRSFDPATRYLLDLSAVPVIRHQSDLPVVVDPSHGTGHRHLIPAMARAAIAAGADGLILEVHPRPTEARSDGAQALLPEDFSMIVAEIEALAPMLGKVLARRAHAAEPKSR